MKNCLGQGCRVKAAGPIVKACRETGGVIIKPRLFGECEGMRTTLDGRTAAHASVALQTETLTAGSCEEKRPFLRQIQELSRVKNAILHRSPAEQVSWISTLQTFCQSIGNGATTSSRSS